MTLSLRERLDAIAATPEEKPVGEDFAHIFSEECYAAKEGAATELSRVVSLPGDESGTPKRIYQRINSFRNDPDGAALFNMVCRIIAMCPEVRRAVVRSAGELCVGRPCERAAPEVRDAQAIAHVVREHADVIMRFVAGRSADRPRRVSAKTRAEMFREIDEAHEALEELRAVFLEVNP